MDGRLTILDRTLRLLAEYVEASPEEISEALAANTVTIAADKRHASGEAVQAAIATLVSLLVRSGIGVHLRLPSVDATTPLLTGDVLYAVSELAEATVRGSTVSTRPPRDDLVVNFASRGTRAQRILWPSADATTGGFSEFAGAWTATDPMAGLTVANMLAAEIIRHAVRHLRPRSEVAEAWLEPTNSARRHIPQVGRDRIDLGDLDCISGGAITHALLWTAKARGNIVGNLRVFDDGMYDPTNLNRYMLLDHRTAAMELMKVEHLSELEIAGLEIEPVRHRFGVDDVGPARARMVVGADDIAVRHTAQSAEPDWLAIGATSHDEARVTEHWRNGPCAMCAHPHIGAPLDGPIPTIAPVSFEAGFRVAERLLRMAAGNDLRSAWSYATYWPLRPGSEHCGPTPAHPACPRHRVKRWQDAA